jgi:Spy/CpxP family protein refolding chaperone
MQMKKMIRMALMSAAMFVMVATVAKAQDGGAGGGRRGGRGGGGTAAMFKDITLSDAQKASVDSITKVYQEKSAAIRSEANGDMQAAMPKMQENNKARNEAYKSVLTDDQKKTFDANVAAMPQRGGRPPVTI